MDSPTGDAMQHADTLINAILDLDTNVQHSLRLAWPDSWINSALPLGITRALFIIERGQANTPGGVADALGVSRTRITGMLDRLEEEQLLTRTLDRADRRSFLLEVTPAGRQLVRDLDRARRDQLSKALAIMALDQLESLKSGLEALVSAMQTIPRNSERHTTGTESIRESVEL